MNKQEAKKELEKLKLEQERINANIDKRKARVFDIIEQKKELQAIIDKPEGRWKPKRMERYYLVQSDGNICGSMWYDDSEVDLWRYNQNNCFKTKKEAEQHKKKLEILAKYRENSRPFKKEKDNYYSFYDTIKEKMSFNFDFTSKKIETAYFETKEDCKKAVEDSGIIELYIGVE